MPNDIYDAIFDIKELPKLITMVKEFYVARPQTSQSMGQSAPTANTFPALPGQLQTLQGLQLQALSQGFALLKSFMHIIKVIDNPTEAENPINPLSLEAEVEVDLHFQAISMATEEVMEITFIGDREVDLEVIIEVEVDRNLTKVK